MDRFEGRRLEVARAQFDRIEVASDEAALASDGVVLEVERFALTANNVTHAVTREMLEYWRFFPTGDDATGVVPVWGVAEVVASDRDDVVVGERWYGFLPMGTHLAVEPGRVTTDGVVDASPHREGLAGVYQRYVRLHADALHDPEHLDLELLLRPLFTTAFLLAEVVDGDAGDRHDVVVITSASSKTGTALAHLLRDRDVTVVGVTSAGNVEHVTATGLHDRVLSYEELDGLADLGGRAAVVDLAGRNDVVAGVHDHLPRGLATHLVVGATHHDAGVDQPAPAEDAPAPTFFFAPTHAAELARDWGPAVLGQRIATAWTPFVATMSADLRVTELDGLDAAAAAWPGLVEGDVDPGEGLVVVLR